jgi:hypothetical protein
MVASATPTTVTKTCPDCGGVNELTRGKRDGPKIIRKAAIFVAHRPSCPMWLRKVQDHGGGIDVLVHEADEFVLTEWVAAA